MNSFIAKYKYHWPLDLQERLDGKKDWNPENILQFFIWCQADWVIQFRRSINSIEMDRLINSIVSRLTKENCVKCLRYAQKLLSTTDYRLNDDGLMIHQNNRSFWGSIRPEIPPFRYEEWFNHMENMFSYDKYILFTKKDIIKKMVDNGDQRHKDLANFMEMMGTYYTFTEENLNYAHKVMHQTYDDKLIEDFFDDDINITDTEDPNNQTIDHDMNPFEEYYKDHWD